MKRHAFWITFSAIYLAWDISARVWWAAIVMAFLLGTEVESTVEDLIERAWPR